MSTSNRVFTLYDFTRDLDLNMTERLVLSAIWQGTTYSEQMAMTYETIADGLKISVRQVKRIIPKLIDMELISREEVKTKKGKTFLYSVNTELATRCQNVTKSGEVGDKMSPSPSIGRCQNVTKSIIEENYDTKSQDIIYKDKEVITNNDSYNIDTSKEIKTLPYRLSTFLENRECEGKETSLSGRRKKEYRPYTHSQIGQERYKMCKKYLDNEEVIKVVFEFIKMRTTIKKPMTIRALELMLAKLVKLSDDDETRIKILDQSIVNSWQGIFALIDPHNSKGGYRNYVDPKEEEKRKRMEEINAVFKLTQLGGESEEE